MDELDELSFEIGLEGDGSYAYELYIYTLINGKLIASGDMTDIFALEESFVKEGELYILTCTCGDPVCAGIYEGVFVKKEKIERQHFITWQINFPEDYVGTYHFDLTQYTKAIQKLKYDFAMLWYSKRYKIYDSKNKKRPQSNIKYIHQAAKIEKVVWSWSKKSF